MEILKYRQVDKGSIVARFDLKIPKWGGFIIREITLFSKNGGQWISFPSKSFEVDGQKKYMSYNLFEDSTIMKSFQDHVLKALDEYLKKNHDS